MPQEIQLTPEQQKEFNDRLALFNKDFEAVQLKYGLRAVARVPFPGGAVMVVPITVELINPAPSPYPAGQNGGLSKPE